MRENGRKLLIILLLAIALICAGYLIWYYGSAFKAKDQNEIDIKEPVVVEPETEPEENVEIPIDFDALKETNPDVYAWIKVDGTVIDYPVVQRRSDEDYYLNHSWDGSYAAEGALFTQGCNSTDFTDFNTVIYGHQMGAGVETMFHQLAYFLDADFLKENQNVVIYTPDHIRTYRIFAAVVYDDRHLIQYFNYVVNEERQEFLDSIYNSRDLRNQYCEEVEVTIDDKILSLSTCISGEPKHRLLVEAVLIDEK